MLDTTIENITYVNARVRKDTTFHLYVDQDFDQFVVGVEIRDADGKRQRMEFPHYLSRNRLFTIAPNRALERLIGPRNALYSMKRHELHRVAEILKDLARLEIGFYHDDIEKDLYKNRTWFLGEDADEGHCGCRFALDVGGFRTEWWLGWYRVKKVLVCTREQDQEFAKVWEYTDDYGWGLIRS